MIWEDGIQTVCMNKKRTCNLERAHPSPLQLRSVYAASTTTAAANTANTNTTAAHGEEGRALFRRRRDARSGVALRLLASA